MTALLEYNTNRMKMLFSDPIMWGDSLMYLVNVRASHAYCFMVIWYITRLKAVILQKLSIPLGIQEKQGFNMGSLNIGEIFQNCIIQLIYC